MIMVKKKSYNPFKMLGTYLTGIMFILMFILISSTCGFESPSSCPTIMETISYSSIIFIIIFILSWGVVSLWRRFMPDNKFKKIAGWIMIGIETLITVPLLILLFIFVLGIGVQ